MIIVIQTLLLIFFLLLLHELGHIISAKIMGLSIKKIGVSSKPYPHVFVAVQWAKERIKRYIYLFSGTAVTLTLFLISFSFHFFDVRSLMYAFIIQLIIETNPFYSDFTIAIVTRKINTLGINTKNYYQEIYKNHAFSSLWYIHFIIWACITFLLINLTKLS